MSTGTANFFFFVSRAAADKSYLKGKNGFGS